MSGSGGGMWSRRNIFLLILGATLMFVGGLGKLRDSYETTAEAIRVSAVVTAGFVGLLVLIALLASAVESRKRRRPG